MEGQFCPNCGARAGAPEEIQTAAPQPAAPLPAAPQPATPPPPPAAKKTSPLVWVLVGCGGLTVISVIIAAVFFFFVARKASEFGKNPGFAAAKMMAAMNPDVEVVRADEDTGKITLREKKSGKTVTMDFREIEKGRISFEGEEGRFDIRSDGDGQTGSMTFRGPDGTAQFGSGSLASVPSWVPKYPGGESVGTYVAQSGGEQGGTFQLKCNDSPEEVAAYYEREMKAAGFRVEKHSMRADNRSVETVVGTNDGDRRSVTATVSSSDEGTVVMTVYQSKR
jgi:hypothetical protein